MSLIHHLITTRTPHELAKELAALARENAALLDRAGAAETELFWMKVAERDPPPTPCECAGKGCPVCAPTEDGPGQDEKEGGEP